MRARRLPSGQRLKKIILEDELGICADLEREMDELVGKYFDEWKMVIDDQERQKQFRQFVNTVSCTVQTFARFGISLWCMG